MPSASIERRVLFAELLPEARQQYIESHKAVWPELLNRYREIGYHRITCHLLGNTLVVITEAADLDAVQAVQDADPIDQRWQAWMATLRPAGNLFQVAETVFDVTFNVE